MSLSIPFVFRSGPSDQSYTNSAMPCYDCSMLGYSSTCQSCSPFIAGTPPNTPSSPANDSAFAFEFSSPLATMFSASQPPFAPSYSITATEQPHPGWLSLEAAEPPIKTSRFNWSEMDMSNGDDAFENLTANPEDTHSSISTEPRHSMPYSECPSCTMVPYGALCSTCNRIQTSKATAFATPPAAAWPVTHSLGNWQGTKAQEEELLQTLDTELFDEINVPHERDEWGRRIYNDSGHCILYYQDEDGNTVLGYEAWYPNSVIDDYDEPEDSGRPWDNEAQDAAADDDDEEKIDDYGVLAEYNHATLQAEAADIAALEDEHRRFAEFLAARDDEVSLFEEDRERIAKWVADANEAGDDDVVVSVMDYEEEAKDDDAVSLWSEIS